MTPRNTSNHAQIVSEKRKLQKTRDKKSIGNLTRKCIFCWTGNHPSISCRTVSRSQTSTCKTENIRDTKLATHMSKRRSQTIPKWPETRSTQSSWKHRVTSGSKKNPTNSSFYSSSTQVLQGPSQKRTADVFGLPRLQTKYCAMSGIGIHTERFQCSQVAMKTSTAVGTEINSTDQTKPL